MDVSLRRCYLPERGSGRTLRCPNAVTSAGAVVYGARKMRPRLAEEAYDGDHLALELGGGAVDRFVALVLGLQPHPVGLAK